MCCIGGFFCPKAACSCLGPEDRRWNQCRPGLRTMNLRCGERHRERNKGVRPKQSPGMCVYETLVKLLVEHLGAEFARLFGQPKTEPILIPILGRSLRVERRCWPSGKSCRPPRS